MKKMLMVALCGTLALFLFGCGGGASGGSDGSTSDAPQQEEQKKPLDLSGSGNESLKSGDGYQEATIQDNVIEINWVSDGGDKKSLYWSGTYEAPTRATRATWDSVNDTSKATERPARLGRRDQDVHVRERHPQLRGIGPGNDDYREDGAPVIFSALADSRLQLGNGRITGHCQLLATGKITRRAL